MGVEFASVLGHDVALNALRWLFGESGLLFPLAR